MTVFTDTWNAAFEALPAGSENVSQGDNRIRSLKVAVSERLEVDHSWAGDADDGEHKKVTFTDPLGADPTTGAEKGALYTKDVSSKAELHWKDEDNNVVQVTAAGNLAAGLVGEIKMWPTDTAPSGWLFCDGTAISRTTYSALHDVLKDAEGAGSYPWGNGDGSTTFNVPDFDDRAPVGSTGSDLGDAVGASTKSLSESNMPSHKHLMFINSSTASLGLSSGEQVHKTLTGASGDKYVMSGSSSSATIGDTSNTGSGSSFSIEGRRRKVNFVIYAGV